MSRPKLLKYLLFTSALLAFGSSVAFVPSVGLGAITPGESHAAITKTALNVIYLELGFPKLSSSMEEARSAMLDANASVDDLHKHDSAYHCDAENLNGCNDVINNGVAATVRLLQANNLDEARIRFGRAMHTLQDFYSHSNWIELHRGGLHPQLGRPGHIDSISRATANGDLVNDPACAENGFFEACRRDNITTPLLTSGYFSGQNRDRPAGKCRHGGGFDRSPGTGGISKDMSSCIGTSFALPTDSPHSDNHPAAAALAAQATSDLLRQLKGKVTLRQFKSFLGIGAPFAFAIDTTGSMGSVIAGVKSQVNAILAARAGTNEEPVQYVLAPFNDPTVPPAFVTEDPAAFKSALAALSVSGGGDCPELSMTGTFNAVAAAGKGAQVYTFTDASAKDAAIFGSVYDLATSKRSKLFFPLFGHCSPYDPVYFALAKNTGGQVFVLSPAEAAQVSRLTDMFSRSDTVDILTIHGTLSSAPQTFRFPVDSHISRLNLSISRLGAGSAIIRSPDGNIVTASSPGVTNVPLSNATAFAVATPQTGTWSIQVAGDDTFSILVNGASDLSFPQFTFVEQRGRDGHSGAYPISGSPAPGKTLFALANVGTAASTRSYEFRTPGGAFLSRFTLDSNDPADPTSQTGPVVVPVGPFKIYAVGDDDRRTAYQRVIGSVFNPQTVSVVAPATVDLPIAQATTYIFSVTNSGAPDTFAFKALDDKKFVTSVTPATALLASGASTLVTVVLSPPSSAPIGSVDTLTFSAASASNADSRNFAVLSSTVIAKPLIGDVNRDGLVNCDDLGLVRASFGQRAGMSAFNPTVDLDNNGVIDVRDLALISRQLPAGTTCK